MKKHLTKILTVAAFCLVFAMAQTASAQKTTIPKPVEVKSKLKVGIDFELVGDYDNGFLGSCSDITVDLYRISKPPTGPEKYIKIQTEKTTGPPKAKNGECTVTFLLPIKDKYSVEVNYKNYHNSYKPISLKIADTTQVNLILSEKP